MLAEVSTACREVVEEQMRRERIPNKLMSFKLRELPHLTTSKGDVIPLEKAPVRPIGLWTW